MARAPVPRTPPGSFFLVAFDRESGAYTLVVDDETHSSYNLGDDVAAVMAYFRHTAAPELGYRAVDLAREFGAAQVVPGEDRVFKVTPTPSQRDGRRQHEAAFGAPPKPRVVNSLPPL